MTTIMYDIPFAGSCLVKNALKARGADAVRKPRRLPRHAFLHTTIKSVVPEPVRHLGGRTVDLRRKHLFPEVRASFCVVFHNAGWWALSSKRDPKAT